MNKFDRNGMTQKRPSSPLPDYNKKKAVKVNPSPNYNKKKPIKVNGNVSDSIGEELQKVLARQIELAEQLVFKDAECQQLKKKFDEVDRNCRRWHDFAIGLQTRVKRLALSLNRHQGSMKILQNKEVCPVAKTQTKGNELNYQIGLNTCQSNTDSIAIDQRECDPVKEHGKLKTEQEVNSPKVPELSSSAMVIDLTDEATEPIKNKELSSHFSPPITKMGKPALTKPPPYLTGGIGKLSNAASHVVHHHTTNTLVLVNSGGKPMAPVQTFGRNFTTSNVRPTHKTAATPSPNKVVNSVISKDHVLTLAKQNCTIQKNGTYTHAMKNLKNCTPYPPLPSIPLPPPNLPKQTLPQPPQPLLKIKNSKEGIELSWDHPGSVSRVTMDSYELYVYQHNLNSKGGNRWKKIGNDNIKAMPLPMACTLSQFSTGSKYYFAVRGKDVYGRYGLFSEPCCSSDVQ